VFFLQRWCSFPSAKGTVADSFGQIVYCPKGDKQVRKPGQGADRAVKRPPSLSNKWYFYKKVATATS